MLHFASVFAQKGLTAQLKAPAACLPVLAGVLRCVSQRLPARRAQALS